MSCFSIGGIMIDAESLPSRFDPFRIEAEEFVRRDITLEIVSDCFESLDVIREYDPVQGFLVCSLADGSWSYQYADRPARMLVNTDYSYAQYYSPEEDEDTFLYLFSLVLGCHAIRKGILTTHGSCLKIDGEAVSLSAPSGVGKSTRASYWMEALGAEMISGDRPMILVDERQVFGGPWDGKEQVQHPGLVPLKYICEIRRAPFTKARELTGSQAIAFMTGQVFVPMWDPELAMRTMLLVRKLVSTVPIVRLFCDRTNESAVEARNLLFDNDASIEKWGKDMKLREGFVIKCVVDEYMAVPIDDQINNFGGVVILNEVSAFILENMKNPISKEDLIDLLVAEYEVDRARAAADLDVILAKFSGYGMIEDEQGR